VIALLPVPTAARWPVAAVAGLPVVRAAAARLAVLARRPEGVAVPVAAGCDDVLPRYLAGRQAWAAAAAVVVAVHLWRSLRPRLRSAGAPVRAALPVSGPTRG